MSMPKKSEALRPRPVSVSLSEHQRAILDAAAEQLGVSRSGLVGRFARLLENGALTVEELAVGALRQPGSD